MCTCGWGLCSRTHPVVWNIYHNKNRHIHTYWDILTERRRQPALKTSKNTILQVQHTFSILNTFFQPYRSQHMRFHLLLYIFKYLNITLTHFLRVTFLTDRTCCRVEIRGWSVHSNLNILRVFLFRKFYKMDNLGNGKKECFHMTSRWLYWCSKKTNSGHVDVPNQSCGSWTLF